MQAPPLPVRHAVLATVALTLASAPRAALAQAAPPAAAPAPAAQPAEEEAGPEAGTRRRHAPDTRTGHILLDPRFSFVAPAGFASVSSTDDTSTATTELTGTGVAVGGVLGVGIARHVSLETSGSYALLSGPTGCDACKGRVFDLGLGLAYHLAQGVAVDPWASFGMGYRRSTYSVIPSRALVGASAPTTTGALRDLTYHGWDWLRIGLGTDFYPVPQFGLGPYFEADVGSNFGLPVRDTSPSVYAFFHVGVRIALDPLRRSQASAPAQTAGR